MLLVELAKRIHRRPLRMFHSLPKLRAERRPRLRTRLRFKPCREQCTHRREHCLAAIHGHVRRRRFAQPLPCRCSRRRSRLRRSLCRALLATRRSRCGPSLLARRRNRSGSREHHAQDNGSPAEEPSSGIHLDGIRCCFSFGQNLRNCRTLPSECSFSCFSAAPFQHTRRLPIRQGNGSTVLARLSPRSANACVIKMHLLTLGEKFCPSSPLRTL